jgi:hypothetical protein
MGDTDSVFFATIGCHTDMAVDFQCRTMPPTNSGVLDLVGTPDVATEFYQGVLRGLLLKCSHSILVLRLQQ